MPVPEEKQKARKLDLSKLKNPPMREITTSCPIPSATDNPTIASIKVTTSTPSPAKMCKGWGLPCLLCVQSAQHSSPVDSGWSEEDWGGEIEKEKRKEKQREMEQRQEEEEKKNLDSNYYQPSPVYVPSYQEEPPALVRDLIPKLALEKSRDVKQNKKKTRWKRTEE